MSWAFLRRDWGAITFVLTVLVGIVVVPVALYFGNASPHASTIVPSASPPAVASAARTATPAPSPSPTR